MGGKYRLGRKIGSGSFGDIYLGECVSQEQTLIGAHLLVFYTEYMFRDAYSEVGPLWIVKWHSKELALAVLSSFPHSP